MGLVNAFRRIKVGFGTQDLLIRNFSACNLVKETVQKSKLKFNVKNHFVIPVFYESQNSGFIFSRTTSNVSSMMLNWHVYLSTQLT